MSRERVHQKIMMKRDGSGYVVIWRPNEKSETFKTDQDVPVRSLLAIVGTLEKAIERGNDWAGIHFPREIAK